MAKWIIDRTINLDYSKTKRVLELLMIKPRKDDSELEKILMSEGILKKGVDGALRRRWYTYLRNYGLLQENEVTEMGELYANGCFSLQELALMQLYKRELRIENDVRLRPFKVLIFILKKLIDKYGIENACISQEDFSNYIVNIKNDSEQEIERIFNIIEQNKKNHKDVIQGEHTDIWFNNIKQTDLFEIIGKGIFVKEDRIKIFELIYNSLLNDIRCSFDSFKCPFVDLIKEFNNCQVSNEKLAHAENIIYDYLFNGFSVTKLAQKYYKLDDEKRIEDDLKSLGIMPSEDNIGIYKSWIGYEGIVGIKLQKSQNKTCQYVGKLISRYAEKNRKIDDLCENIESNETIEERILKQYEIMDFSKMENDIISLYNEFQVRFGPNALLAISDEELPKHMFYSDDKNKDNMCYFLEKNSEISQYFGKAGVYSSYVYYLHFNDKLKSWVTGSGKNPIMLDYQGAIEKAKEIRQNLVDACDIVRQYKDTNSIADYTKMFDELKKKCSTGIYNCQWFVKYLHMMFPNLFATYYSENWQRYLIKKCGLQDHNTIYERSGELSLLSNRVGLQNAVVGNVLFALFRYPDNEDDLEELNDEYQEEEEKKKMVERKPRTVKIFGLNTILYGAPGTGKTYSTTEYAVAMIENRKIRENISHDDRELLKQIYRKFVENGQIVFTTFHQSYGYEDFVQGLRPHPVDGNIQFSYENGVFKEIADRARKDQDNNYVIIIDEINRGNISKIFGELITLIEDDKRWGEENQLSALLPSHDEFVVPNNLYILGTMNSADKSISLIDTALRRRFDFIEVVPNPELIKDVVLKDVLLKLNATLRKVKDSSDLLVGHAYFMHKTKDDLVNIMNKNIIPLLYEYCYDNETKISDIVIKALDGTGISIDQENKQGRIRVK